MNHRDSDVLKGRFTPVRSIANLDEKWRALEADSDCSFFLSWGWIGTWVAQVQHVCDLHLYELHFGENLIALAIIELGNASRHGVIKSKTITLHEASDPQRNMFIEYNGIVASKGYEQQAWQKFLEDMCSHLPDWDELELRNIPEHSVDEKLAQQLNLHLAIDAQNFAWITPLNDINGINSIIDKLKPNRRWQLRRSFKEYESEGKLVIDAAENIEQALEYFHELGYLHSARWQKVGKKGAYARANWVDFHCNLIRNVFNLNQIQLLRIRCNNRNIGFIYNFLWRDTVLVLQTGFVSEQRNVLRPGYISHLLAMQLNANLGAIHYDFMIGESEYKRVLGNAVKPQVTVRLQKDCLTFKTERLLQSCKRAIHSTLYKPQDQ